RRVALKLIRDSFATEEIRRRFENEANALGRLEHPGIARIYEAGAAQLERQVCPFFAMEFIDGPPIDRFVRDEGPRRVEVVELMARVCDAVQHAHERGIVHRDLKPANILVEKVGTTTATRHSSQTAGPAAPKILDFGVARFVDPDARAITVQTGASQLVGTIAYMSPEQLDGDPAQIDARTDVYALGVMLFELLAGRPPIELSGVPIAEAARLVRDTPPRTLTSVDKSLRGDLDTIVATAMERDRDRRYASAAALAEDLRRYLASEPIAARPPSTLYQLSKFASRNKALVGGVAASFALLVAGVIGTSIGLASALEANRSLTSANQELEELNETLEKRNDELQEVGGFQVEQIRSIDPQDMGETLRAFILDNVRDDQRTAFERSTSGVNFTSAALEMLRKDLFEQTRGAIENDFESRPEIRANLLEALSTTTGQLSLYDLAIPTAQSAIEVRSVALGATADQTLAIKMDLAKFYVDTRAVDEAEALYREVLPILVDRYGETNTDVLAIRRDLAQIKGFRGDYAGAGDDLTEILRLLRENAGDDDPQTLDAMFQLANVLNNTGREAAAVPLLEELVEGRTARYGPEDQRTLSARGELASVLTALGRFDEAEAIAREIADLLSASLGDDHRVTTGARSELAEVLFASGRFAQAEAIHRDVLERRLRTLGPDHQNTLTTRNNLAGAIDAQGRFADAEPIYRESLDAIERVLGPEHPSTIMAIGNLGYVINQQGKRDEAEVYYRRAYELSASVLGPDSPRTLTSMSNLAQLLLQKGEIDEGTRMNIEAFEGRVRLFGEDHPATFIGYYNIGSMLLNQGKPEESEPYSISALEKYESLGSDHIGTLHSLGLVARLRDAQGRSDEALQYHREALDRRTESLGRGHPLTQDGLGDLAFALLDIGRPAEAEPLFREQYETLVETVGPDEPSTLNNLAAVGRAILDQGDAARAAPPITDAWQRLTAAFGEDSPNVNFARFTLAALREAQGDLQGSLVLFRRTYESRLESLGPDDDRTIKAREAVDRVERAIADLDA
ncbi:MAG: serine/threonine-protein kinase, partial [Planctomycetota bacterium]